MNDGQSGVSFVPPGVGSDCVCFNIPRALMHSSCRETFTLNIGLCCPDMGTCIVLLTLILGTEAIVL